MKHNFRNDKSGTPKNKGLKIYWWYISYLYKYSQIFISVLLFQYLKSAHNIRIAKLLIQ